MKNNKLILVLSLLAVLMSVFGSVVAQENDLPAIKVSTVIPDEKVVLETKNFPAETAYLVSMASSETPENFTAVAKFNSKTGGKLSVTVKIPAIFQGLKSIELKLEDDKGGVILGNFVNIPDEVTEQTASDETITLVNQEEQPAEEPEKEEPVQEEQPAEEPEKEEPVQEEQLNEQPGDIELVNEAVSAVEASESSDSLTCDFSQIPTVTITDVVRNESVTFVTSDFPANSNFSVSMGYYVETWTPVREPVFEKPRHEANPRNPLPGVPAHEPITIGDETFYVLEPTDPNAPDFRKSHKPTEPRITGYVTSKFTGTQVGTFNTGDGSSQSLTFEIPSSLSNVSPIAIWISDLGPCGFYSYNYFYNNSTN